VKIGVVGLGAVGETVFHALKFYHKEVLGYDKFKPSNTLEEVVKSNAVFLALPTNPKNGHLDCSLINEYLDELERRKYSGVVIIKSTMPLDFVKELENRKLRIVTMPEFLHENARLQDFVSPKIVVIAGKKEDVDFVMSKVFYWQDRKIPVYRVDHMTAVMMKLVMNACAATKISFANEVRRLCEDYGVDPRLVMNALVSEGRAAQEYTNPMKGPFDGRCLPKDLEELINCSNKTILLRAVKEVNEAVKKETGKK